MLHKGYLHRKMLTLGLFVGVCIDGVGSNPGAHWAHGMDLRGHLTATREAAVCLAGQTWPPNCGVCSSNDHTRNPNPRTRMILQGILGLRGPFFWLSLPPLCRWNHCSSSSVFEGSWFDYPILQRKKILLFLKVDFLILLLLRDVFIKSYLEHKL